MRPRWLLPGFLLLVSCLPACTGGAPPATLTPTLRAATPAIALPTDCAPLIQYHSTDAHGASCIAVICEDGRIARTSGCSTVAQAPDQITEEQLVELRERINRSNFFAQDSYYRASADC